MDKSTKSKNPDFVEQVKTYASLDTPIIMMLIGGAFAACELLAEHGFTNLTNMTEGFEGRADEKNIANTRAAHAAFLASIISHSKACRAKS